MTASPLHLARACVLAIAIATLAAAQSPWPAKPIKIIAPVQPGGGVDLVARQVGDRLSRALGQPVVVENQSGGGGVVGSLATARAAPDGYTLMDGYVGTHGTSPAARKLPYDASKDFTADRDGRRHAERAGGAAVAAAEDARGIRRLREGQSRQASATARPARARSRTSRWNSSRRRRPRHRAHSVPRHRARVHRHSRRPDAGDVPGAGSRAAAHQGRQGACRSR